MRLTDELPERTKRYAGSTIHLYVKVPLSRKEVAIIGQQLLRSGTSVSAHARGPSRGRSDAEFSKLEGALQEADESELWLELLRDDCPITTPQVSNLLTETDELIAIFTTIVERTKRRRDK